MKLSLYTCLLFCLLWTPATAIPLAVQDMSQIQNENLLRTPVSFDQDQINKYKEQAEFNYSQETEDTWWTRFKRYLRLQWNSFMNWIFGDIPTSGFLLFLLQALPYVILLGMLIFLVWLFNRMNPGKMLLASTAKDQVFLNEEEEIVQTRNIREMIEKALADKDYRSAIRYQYLLVLQTLNQQEIIKYQSAKTNEEYAREINSEALRNAFRQLSRVYDYTWYGSFSASKEVFKKMEQDHQQVVKLTEATHEQK